MAFLDNSSDIVLDAVITPTGRVRLAQGRFKIIKFALGDDEILYSFHDSAVGTVYQDLNILRTPVLEASPNVGIKHHLVTRERNDILYLPVLKLNEFEGAWAEGKARADSTDVNAGFYVVLCDQASVDQFEQTAGDSKGYSYTSFPDFITNGLSAEKAATGKLITLEQGLDTLEIPFNIALGDEFEETVYDVYVDDRFLQVVTPAGRVTPLASVDANEAAHYILAGEEYISHGRPDTGQDDLGASGIAGPRGFVLKFDVMSSEQNLRSMHNFNKFGRIDSTWAANTTGMTASPYTAFALIDTTVRVVGRKNNFAVDIPIRCARASS